MSLRHFAPAGPALAPLAMLLVACGSSGPARLGCHQYCLNAGGYGGGPSGTPMTTVVSTRAKVLGDGTVPIAVRCDYHAACTGALLLDNYGDAPNPCQGSVGAPGARTQGWWAQSDLSVSAGATRTIAVTLSSCARQLLARNHTLRAAVTADTLAGIPTADRARWDGLVSASVTITGT